MKRCKNYCFIFLSTIFISSLFSCNQHNRAIVPYDTDSEEVLKPILPNDEDSPDNLTFGSKKIPGFKVDYEVSTSDSSVYVYFDDFTILDVNPGITQDIVNFICSNMKDNDFLPDSLKLSENIFSELLNSGLTPQQSFENILSQLKEGFENKIESLQPLVAPFNLYFTVFPIFLDDKYVTYRLYAYSYTGGAHGTQYSYLKTYDLESGKYMTLDDLVKPEGLEVIHEEVAAHMAYSYPIYENITTVNQYVDSLNHWLDNFDSPENNHPITIKNFPLPDPALTNDGLAFIYQMYELTPGSDGCPLVVIPYSDIKGCLKL